MPVITTEIRAVSGLEGGQRLFGDGAFEVGATLGSGDELDAVPLRVCSPRTLSTASVSPATSRAAISSPPGRVRAAWTEVLAALTPAQRATIVATMRAYEAALEKHTSYEAHTLNSIVTDASCPTLSSWILSRRTSAMFPRSVLTHRASPSSRLDT
jgi:hypothetical protein